MTTLIRDLLRPLEPSVCETQSLEAAKEALTRAQSEHVVIRDLHHRPVGVITREEIKAFEAALPERWSRRRCAGAVASMPAGLHPDQSPEACVQYYRDHGIRPMIVADAQGPVGLLHPTEVFQWCALRDAEVVEELADQARGLHRRTRPRRQRGSEPSGAGARA